MQAHAWLRRGTAAIALILAAGCGTNSNSSSSDPMAGMNHGGSGMGAMDGAHEMDGPIGDGTRATENGFTIALASAPSKTGLQPVALTLRGPNGEPVDDAVLEQTKKMHLIVARHDLTGYQHVHPLPAGKGQWNAEVDFATPGTWRLIADVTPIAGGRPQPRVALGIDVTIPGDVTNTPLPPAADLATVDGYEVTKQGTIAAGVEHDVTFAITTNGAPATGITEYLGAGGHLVALAEGTLAYTHLHPTGGPGPTLTFMASLPTAGRYRLFLQFATNGEVHTAELTVVA